MTNIRELAEKVRPADIKDHEMGGRVSCSACDLYTALSPEVVIAMLDVIDAANAAVSAIGPLAKVRGFDSYHAALARLKELSP